jgi:hypothetical protein
MKSDKLLGEEILAMQNEKGKICVSIIVPTHRLSPDRRVDQLTVERAVESTKQLLQFRYTVSNIKPLLEAIDDWYESIDFNRNLEGLGLYLSPGFKLAVKFPFPVTKKVIVGDNFEIRDLLYKVNYAKAYFVLHLTQKDVRLFEGSWDELEEIKDNHFPTEYAEAYSYDRPSRGTPGTRYAQVRNFEKDKSALEEIRFEDFYRTIDNLLNDYLVGDTPMILLGSEEEVTWFKNISAHNNHIIQKIKGNYNHATIDEISTIVWPAMEAHLKEERKELIEAYKEKIGEHRAINGISEVWQAVKDGKAWKLLVEKDYRKAGFVSKEMNHLYIHPPKIAHRIVADAVDDICEMVLASNGQVFFTDNGQLKDYQHIALITRY